jgi:uncharacterized Zn ribbon protein
MEEREDMSKGEMAMAAVAMRGIKDHIAKKSSRGRSRRTISELDVKMSSLRLGTKVRSLHLIRRVASESHKQRATGVLFLVSGGGIG